MANVKISNFTPQTNVRLLDGFAAYEGTVNKKISGSQLVTSVINSNGSGTPSTATIGRVAFYGIGGDSLGGSGSLNWDNPNSTLIIGNSTFNGALEIFGNYATGNTQPAITFHGGDSASANDFDFIIKTQPDGADQTWLLPKSLPSANQFLKVSNITVNDVELEWAAAGSSGIADVLTANDTTNAGQEILFTGDGIIQTGTTKYNAAGILDQTIGGGFFITRANFGDVSFTASFGNISLTAAGVGNKIQFNTDTRFVSDIYDGSNSAGTTGQVLSSLGAGNGVDWVNKDADKAFVALTGSTPTWTIKSNYNATWTPPAGAVTLNITASAGDSGAIIIDSSNSPTITYPATSNFTGGTPPTLSGGTDILSFLYDGTNYYWTYGLDFQP